MKAKDFIKEDAGAGGTSSGAVAVGPAAKPWKPKKVKEAQPTGGPSHMPYKVMIKKDAPDAERKWKRAARILGYKWKTGSHGINAYNIDGILSGGIDHNYGWLAIDDRGAQLLGIKNPEEGKMESKQVRESASAGGTSSGAVATVVTPLMKKPIKRKMAKEAIPAGNQNFVTIKLSKNIINSLPKIRPGGLNDSEALEELIEIILKQAKSQMKR